MLIIIFFSVNYNNIYIFSSKGLQNNMPIFCCCCPYVRSICACVVCRYVCRCVCARVRVRVRTLSLTHRTATPYERTDVLHFTPHHPTPPHQLLGRNQGDPVHDLLERYPPYRLSAGELGRCTLRVADAVFEQRPLCLHQHDIFGSYNLYICMYI